MFLRKVQVYLMDRRTPEITIAFGADMLYPINCRCQIVPPMLKNSALYCKLLDKIYEDKFGQWLAISGEVRYNQNIYFCPWPQKVDVKSL